MDRDTCSSLVERARVGHAVLCSGQRQGRRGVAMPVSSASVCETSRSMVATHRPQCIASRREGDALLADRRISRLVGRENAGRAANKTGGVEQFKPHGIGLHTGLHTYIAGHSLASSVPLLHWTRGLDFASMDFTLLQAGPSAGSARLAGRTRYQVCSPSASLSSGVRHRALAADRRLRSVGRSRVPPCP